MTNVVAGTGHRPPKLGGYDDYTAENLTTLAIDWLTLYKPYKPVSVISGMALGWDQALAAAAIRLKIPFTAAVPFPGYERKWPTESIKRYTILIGHCSELVFVSNSYNGASTMQLRNEWMVDRCDLLLALWDGSKGGTANCIRYAERKNVKIENLWNRWTS